MALILLQYSFSLTGGRGRRGRGTSLVGVTDWLTSGKYCMIHAGSFKLAQMAEIERKKEKN
jgi:hypothetical protein